MRFGICTSNFEDAEYLYELGYDYLEFGLQRVAELEDKVFEEFLKKGEKSLLKVEVFNSFVRKKLLETRLIIL